MSKRLFVIFLDGADEGFVRQALSDGLLPNLAAMAKTGTYSPLATSCPAESPVAFAEVLTGRNPGKHGLFDFLHRDPATRLPSIALFDYDGERFTNNLAAPTFCTPLKNAGIKTALVRIPSTFPPPDDADLVLSGLGVPDASGTWGRAQLFSKEADASGDIFGTMRKTYRREHDHYLLDLDGPGATATLKVERTDDKFLLNGVELPREAFGPWMRVTFENGKYALIAVHVRLVDGTPEFLVTPCWTDPLHASLPACRPDDLARVLAEQHGDYPLAGWAEPNLLLAEGLIERRAFFEMCRRVADATDAHIFDILNNTDYDLVMANLEFFDRVAHAGFGPAAAKDVQAQLMGVLVRFDAFVGKVRDAHPDATLWIASDHGFAPWTRRVNVNRWLAENGYLRADLAAPDPDLRTLAGEGVFWSGVDWSRSRAYAVGLSKIYLNLEGREAGGIVAPGKPVRELKQELIERLTALRDPENGKAIFRRVLDAQRLYSGQALGRSGDLILCYNPGYRTDWASSLGGTGTPVVAANDREWSADHCGVDPELIPGIFFSASAIEGDGPALRDIAPSILRFFGLPPDPDMDGRPILR
ncbi:MAG: alkaline phosphatase family protein [Deltaproteobacteria bacterium]|nr:alkaline phosphatase family protein [Deltaproteobacteria bacterium]